MEEHIQSWPYFDEGVRPPTLYELVQELQENSKVLYTELSVIMGNSTIRNNEECSFKMVFSGGAFTQQSVDIITEFEHSFLGMQGPAYARFTVRDKTYVEFSHDVYITFIGHVYYK